MNAMCLDASTSAPFCRQQTQADSRGKKGLPRTGSYHVGLDRGARQLDLKSQFLNLMGGWGSVAHKKQTLEELEEDYEDEGVASLSECGQEGLSQHGRGLAVCTHTEFASPTSAESLQSPLADAATPPSLWLGSNTRAHEDMDMDQGQFASPRCHNAFGRAVRSTLGRPPMPPYKSQSLPSSPLQQHGRSPGATPQFSENGGFAPFINARGFPCSPDSPTNLLKRSFEVKKRAADSASDDLCLMQVREKIQRMDFSDTFSPHQRECRERERARDATSAISTLPVGPLPENMK